MRAVRLHKYIGNCGYTARRRAELLIQAGRVQVNGRVVTELGTSIRPGKDEVRINGDIVTPVAPVTILFHKPPGCITSTHDTHERLTVMDLLPRRMMAQGVKPVGRLDQDTAGLLILTSDGDLNHRVTHPRYEIEKEYEAVVRGRPSREALLRLEKGIDIEGKLTEPARVTLAQPLPQHMGSRTRVRLVIHEGRKRQVKKMFDAIAHPVEQLARIRVGGLEIGDLAPGAWRPLAAEEILLLTRGADGERVGVLKPREALAAEPAKDDA